MCCFGYLFSVTLFFLGAFLLPILLLVSKEYDIFVEVTKNIVAMARQKASVKPKKPVSRYLSRRSKKL